MAEVIRVLHVLGGVGPGGAESRIMDLYRQMDRERVQFDFLVHSAVLNRRGGHAGERQPEFYDEEIQELGGHIYVLPKFRVYNYFSYKRAAEVFFREHHGFRVVQGHMTSTASIYLPLAKKYGIPVTVAHSRNAGVEKGWKGLATRFFRRNLADRADYLFACSELAGKDAFGTAAMEQNRVRIIHNAIDVRRFLFDAGQRESLRAELGIADRFVLGHVGRFNTQKNHPFLIDVFAEVCKQREDAVLLLVGDGPGRVEIEEKCRELSLSDRVLFVGNRRDVWRFYQAFDLFVLPSLYEGLPGVLVEAQAAGLPCFVSDTVTREAQATELVQYLSLSLSPAKWALRMVSQTNAARENMYDRMRSAGFDVTIQAQGYQKFYEKGDLSGL